MLCYALFIAAAALFPVIGIVFLGRERVLRFALFIMAIIALIPMFRGVMGQSEGMIRRARYVTAVTFLPTASVIRLIC